VALFNQTPAVDAQTYLVVKVIEDAAGYSQVGVIVLFVDHLTLVQLVVIDEVSVDPKADLLNFIIILLVRGPFTFDRPEVTVVHIQASTIFNHDQWKSYHVPGQLEVL
jgi:hypothetical protein